MGKTTNKIIVIASLIAMTTFLSLAVIGPAQQHNQQIAFACGGCWHVTPGQTYPAQFNDNDLGQVVKMDCKIMSNDGKGNLITNCIEK